MFDSLVFFAIIGIWIIITINAILLIAGYLYYLECEKRTIQLLDEKDCPSVSIMIPAHNEAKVIARTVQSMLSLNYPPEKLQIIVINDNSSDGSAEILTDIQKKYPNRNIKVINTNKENGGKGKSNALNIGFKESTGEYIAIYDADNTPEKDALLHLVTEIVGDPTLGAVTGKFRTRNKNVNLLTRFINIETLSFQWMSTGGRWKLFKLCMIPGTNFIVRRNIIEKIGGWDSKALAEDTEISFRIYMMGYFIKFIPNAVTWEQEPQTLAVWFKQRSRWVKGNIYVMVKYSKLLFDLKARRIWFDLIYNVLMYVVLLINLTISDLALLLGLFGIIELEIVGFNNVVWIMAVSLFILSIFLTLTTEKGEFNFSNLLLILLMYFTYCKAWLFIAIYGFFMYIKDSVLKRETKWYKTERFD